MPFPAQFNLSDLDGSNGFVINGIDAGDSSGYSVSDAGDINGDGVDDLIIGARLADPNGNDRAGESYVVFGSNSGFSQSFDLSTLDGSNGFVLNGIDVGDRSGYSVSGAGDINGDGVDDLIIGAPVFFTNLNSTDGRAGESYVVFGSNSGFSQSFDLSTLDGSNGFVLNGIDVGDRSGYSVSGAGDINGDGVDDLIIGAPFAEGNSNSIFFGGESYVVFGSNSDFSQNLDLSSLDGSNGFVINGIDVGDRSGFSVSDAGDINGDGVDDLIIGSPSSRDVGESYVVFGSNSGFSQSLDLSSLNGSNGFAISGINAGSISGISVSSAGDINGDGVDDLIISIGAPYTGRNPSNFRAAEGYVVFGSNSGFSQNLDLSTLDGSNGFVLNGIDSFFDRSGFSVSDAGDINGDGVDDLIIGVSNADPNGNRDAGESYVVFGSNSGFSQNLDLSTLDGSNGFVLNGIDPSDLSGRSVSGAGDINGDGVDDLIIGALQAEPNGNSGAGESYVVFGVRDVDDLALVQVNGTPVTNPVESYGGSQDNPSSGTVEISPSNQLNITGNRWQKVEVNSTITSNTVLRFEFAGNGAGEIQGIGFDNNNVVGADDRGKFFQVDGSQNFGIDDLDQFITGGVSGFTQYSVPVGDFFTGDFDFLTIANDDDQPNPDAEAQFRNIELFEAPTNLLDVSINGVVETLEVLSYGGTSQNPDITVTTSNNTELQLEGNGFRRLDITGFEITSDTVLNFEFAGNGVSEIQGIGFDNNNVVGADDRGKFFQVDGSQNFGIDDLDQFITGGAGGFTEYSIPVGNFFTGNFDFLTFGNDQDVANPTAVAQFQNIELIA